MKTCNYQTTTAASQSQAKTLSQQPGPRRSFQQEYNSEYSGAIKPGWLEQRVLNRLTTLIQALLFPKLPI